MKKIVAATLVGITLTTFAAFAKTPQAATSSEQAVKQTEVTEHRTYTDYENIINGSENNEDDIDHELDALTINDQSYQIIFHIH